MDMVWLTPEKTGSLWEIKARRVQAMCSNGKILVHSAKAEHV